MTVFISLHAIAVSSVFRSLHIQQYGKQQEIEHFTLNWFWWADEMRMAGDVLLLVGSLM